MIKKSSLLMLTISFMTSPLINAKVIELSTFNPDKCRQQLISGGDEYPMVMTYMVGCGWSKKLRPIYEEVSEMFPNRRFYAYAFSDDQDLDGDYARARTAQTCLGIIPFASPRIFVYEVNPPIENYTGRIKGLTKLGLDGASTKEEIINFMIPLDPNPNLKLKSHSSSSHSSFKD